MREQDLTLLKELRLNARESLSKISRRTQIPVSTLFDRTKKFENNIIKKFTALIDFEKIGYKIQAFQLIKIGKKDEFERFIENEQSVNAVYKLHDSFDYLVEIICKDINGLQQFNEKIEEFNIINKQSFLRTGELKREAFLRDGLTYLEQEDA